ncbi:MAG: STAS domain-containing protein [Anaerovorax sp.]
MSLKIDRNYNHGKWEIKVVGEADLYTASNFRTTLEEIYSEKKADFLMDISELVYMDSTGLGVIIGAYGRMKESGNKLTLLKPASNIKKLLSITKLDKVLCAE